MIFVLPRLLLLRIGDLCRARAPPSRRPVELTVPIGDDGQMMSGASGARPVLWLRTTAMHVFLRLRRALFRSLFVFLV